MIRARRRLHRSLFTVLVIVVPVLLATVILFRPTVPPVASISPALIRQGGFATSESTTPNRVGIDTREFEISAQDDSDTGEIVLEIRPTKVILKPDLLVYWTQQAAPDDSLPPQAVLIGRLSGTARRALRLPKSAVDARTGSILIYSLAHHEIVARIALDEALAMSRRG